jgi:hypothetical protein
MALEALCGMPVRGKMMRSFEQGESGFDVREEFLNLSKDPECLEMPPFVSFDQLILHQGQVIQNYSAGLKLKYKGPIQNAEYSIFLSSGTS